MCVEGGGGEGVSGSGDSVLVHTPKRVRKCVHTYVQVHSSSTSHCHINAIQIVRTLPSHQSVRQVNISHCMGGSSALNESEQSLPVKWDEVIGTTIIGQGLKVARYEHGVVLWLFHVLRLPHC